MRLIHSFFAFGMFAAGSLAQSCSGDGPVPTTATDPSEPPVSPVPEDCCCLAYKGACTMNMERMFHIKLFYSRKQGITPGEFNRYWANDHAALTTPFLSRLGVVKYSQYHSTPEFRDQGRVEGAPQILEFDGAAEFWVPDLETFQRMGSDPEYLNVIVPDEAKFIDQETIRMIIGVDYTVLEHQNVVTDHGRTFE